MSQHPLLPMTLAIGLALNTVAPSIHAMQEQHEQGHEHPGGGESVLPRPALTKVMSAYHTAPHDDNDEEDVHGDLHDKDGEEAAAHSAPHDNDDEKDGLGDEHDEGGEEAGVIRLSSAQQQMIGLNTVALQPRPLRVLIRAPGEVVANRYGTSVVASLTDARILKRHAVLGDHVSQGKALVTLFSDTLVTAQAGLQTAFREWQLVKELGEQASGRKRYGAAQANYLHAVAQLQAYGLSASDIESLARSTSSRPLGQFVLNAPHAGVIQSDNFLLGAQVSAGQALFTLVDESDIWVEALLPPETRIDDGVAPRARVVIGNRSLDGRIIQRSHSINENTRTRMIRIAINNSDHSLHPGLFATVELEQGDTELALVVAEQALTRTEDGDWAVFYEVSSGMYRQQEVEVLRDLPDSRAISGLEPGTRIVVEGAFFLASEQAKSGFDIHGH